MNDDAPEFPRDAKPWLEMLTEAEERDRSYHARCDTIDKMYAHTGSLASSDLLRDRELQIFWANLQVLNPTIYSREPKPVVSPRFRDRKPLPRRTGDILERSLIADVERDGMHDELVCVRDDLGRLARGVVRVSLVEDDKGVRPKVDHVFRRDFRHGGARKWKELPWCAWRGYYTREEYEARFKAPAPEGVEFKDHRKERAGEDSEKAFTDRKCAVWEIWHKPKRKVVFVAEGAKEISDVIDPPWRLDAFWPVAAAYGTLKPESLTPIPDVVYYEDQLGEINDLTDRIAKLCDALKLKGFYNAGTELGSAIEAVLADKDNGAVLVPVHVNLGPNASMRDAIQWMPVEVIANVIAQCIEVRKQLIQDVYEITGLSDIMRGATEAQETLGAQQLKAQFGSVRVKERQAAMQRLARDVFRIKAEMFAEHVPIDDLLALSQVDDLPRQADVEAQVAQLMQQGQQIAMQAQQALAQATPETGPQIEQQAQAALEPIQAQMQEAQAQVTVEAVEALLRDQKLRPFVLEVETDSTIEPDQMAEKQNRVEFMTALGPLLQQGVQAMQLAPQLGNFIAESIRFVASGFKVARSMDDAIDELAEGFANYQPPQPPQEPDNSAAEMEARMAEVQAKAQEGQAKLQLEAQKMQVEAQSKERDAQLAQAEMQIKAQETGKKIELLDAQIQKIFAEIKADDTRTAFEAAKIQLEARKVDHEGRRVEQDEQRVGFEGQKVALDGRKVEQEGAIGMRQIDVSERAAGIKEPSEEAPRKRSAKIVNIKRGPDGLITEAQLKEDDDDGDVR
jgi:hypothetical protein